MNTKIDSIEIAGFKSIAKDRPLHLTLGDVNILLGPNGAGKSNIISFFRMLNFMMSGTLQNFVATNETNQAFLLLLFCYNLYAKQGVVRNIPTLDIYVNNPSSYVIKDYCDRNYSYNHDFPKNTRKNILVIGDSFGRDWINVLREGGIDKDMDISYISGSDSVSPKRITAADYIFIAYSSNLDKITPYFPLIIGQKKFWIVGTKNFGKTSSFYLQLPSKDYKRMVALPRNPERSLNIKWKQLYGKHYIDMMGLIQNSDGKVPVFTPDGKFFSFDGSHLSRGGAIYYAQHLPLREYFQ